MARFQNFLKKLKKKLQKCFINSLQIRKKIRPGHSKIPSNFLLGRMISNAGMRPCELIPQFTTIEYTLPQQRPTPGPVFLFVVDTCMPEDELQSLKDNMVIYKTKTRLTTQFNFLTVYDAYIFKLNVHLRDLFRKNHLIKSHSKVSLMVTLKKTIRNFYYTKLR